MENKILFKAPIEISARHIHLNQKDFIKLFGKEAVLKPVAALSQKGQFASDSFVTLLSKDKTKQIKLRVLGPFRAFSQIELSSSDAYMLGYKIPIRLSGNIDDAPKIKVATPLGAISVAAIVPQRHLHIPKSLAQKYGLKDSQPVACEIKGCRKLIFKNIIVRIDDEAVLALHLDTDEGNAAGVIEKARGQILKS